MSNDIVNIIASSALTGIFLATAWDVLKIDGKYKYIFILPNSAHQ